MLVVEVIPFESFKEQIRLVKTLLGQGKVSVGEGYITVERWEKNCFR